MACCVTQGRGERLTIRRESKAMENPVLVEVTRGALVESRHRGAACVVDARGSCRSQPRRHACAGLSALCRKGHSALVLVESGAAERYRFGDEELALACASHSGEPGHVAGVERMLAHAGLDVSALQCGTHWPTHRASADALVRAGRSPSPLHHNCSGKHAGFLCATCQMGRTYAATRRRSMAFSTKCVPRSRCCAGTRNRRCHRSVSTVARSPHLRCR